MGRRGRLKIYFGYSPGVGKTYRMLKEAHEKSRKGVDVVAGYIDSRSSNETKELLEGLEVLPFKKIYTRRGMVTEFHLEGALFRKPQIILIDEMAHANANGSKHEKRFQDIEELLEAGISVHTTINAHQIEGLSKVVNEFLQMPFEERIPDYIFDFAEYVEFIDPEPEELIRRYREGKINTRNRTLNLLKESLNNLDKLRALSVERSKERINQVCNWS